jgi:hypothetical protein
LLSFVLATVGCSMPTKVRSMFGGGTEFRVNIAPNANENSAVAVDALVVYDAKVLDLLLKTKASDWFAKKQQFLSDYRDAIDIKSWEWIPSQAVPKQSLEYHAGAKKVLVFADYATAGDHRAAVDPQQTFTLFLDTLDMKVTP